MEESQTDVKQEAPSTEEVKQAVNEDVKPEQVPYARFKEVNDSYKSMKANYDKMASKINKIEEDKLIAGGKKDDVNMKSEKWRNSLRYASMVITNRITLDVTEGATHYHATYVRPAWARTKTKSVRINRHIFYRWERK